MFNPFAFRGEATFPVKLVHGAVVAGSESIPALNAQRLRGVEHLEKAVMSLVVQALTDYRAEVVTVFREETDLPQDIAEDLTREALSTMGVSATHDRMYGKVDFIKKGLYVFLPETVPVALMLDAKAEKKNGDRTATIQMSQTSMRVIMNRAGQIIDEKGRLDTEIVRGSHRYQVVTVIAKYVTKKVNQIVKFYGWSCPVYRVDDYKKNIIRTKMTQFGRREKTPLLLVKISW